MDSLGGVEVEPGKCGNLTPKYTHGHYHNPKDGWLKWNQGQYHLEKLGQERKSGRGVMYGEDAKEITE